MGTSSSLLSGYFMQPTRRSYSKPFKAQVIQECAQPGALIASIALSHSLNANLVHKWIRLHTQQNTALQPAFIPLPMPPDAYKRLCDVERELRNG
ncbi:transposase [Pseudomonas sp. 20GA0068]|uniref:Transposase n=2 Tax=Pseudomonas alliivorans TaxID=2810613 RepID=A0ABS4C3B6_9PSED|nr:transposase [Pseudomonas alliivorans]MBP0945141.1 transposase [Pseudomonas alliivorans]